MTGESVIESIRQLTEFQDAAVAMGPIPGSASPVDGTYSNCREHIIRLNRIRKICAHVASNPSLQEELLPLLRRGVFEAKSGFAEAYESKLRDRRLGNRDTRSSSAFADVMRRQLKARTNIYLLGEFEDFSSLPLLLEWFRDDERRVAAPRIWAFAVIHELMMKHPRSPLNPDAERLLMDYRELAKHLARAKVVRAPAWDAEFSESDFRHIFLGQDIGLENQPTVEITVYPPEFDDFEEWNGIPKHEGEPFVQVIEAFVKVRYSETSDL